VAASGANRFSFFDFGISQTQLLALWQPQPIGETAWPLTWIIFFGRFLRERVLSARVAGSSCQTVPTDWPWTAAHVQPHGGSLREPSVCRQPLQRRYGS
jgi:hypothetical protein